MINFAYHTCIKEHSLHCNHKKFGLFIMIQLPSNHPKLSDLQNLKISLLLFDPFSSLTLYHHQQQISLSYSFQIPNPSRLNLNCPNP